MTDFKEPLAKVKHALSRKDLVAEYTQYLVNRRMISATDGRFVASAPIDFDGTFMVPGREFEALVGRLKDIDRITQTDLDITLRAKRSHGTIKTLPTDKDARFPSPGPSWHPVPSGLLSALETARPFISDNATHDWALCACLEYGAVYATTNVSLVEVEAQGVDGRRELLPCWAIDYVLARDDYKCSGVQIEPNFAAFQWEDGSWMRTQLINGEFPEMGFKLFAERWTNPSVEITDEFREAFEVVASLSEGYVEVWPDRLVGTKGAGKVEHEIPLTPVPKGTDCSRWTVRYLEPIIQRATHWQPDTYPQATPFKGDGFRGFIMGRN